MNTEVRTSFTAIAEKVAEQLTDYLKSEHPILGVIFILNL